MSKKKLYLIIGITAIITIGFFLAAYIISREKNTGGEPAPSNPFSNFFPFGKGSGDNGDRGEPGEENTLGDGTKTTSTTNNPLIDPKNLLALRKISETATAGMYPVMRGGKTAVQFVERATGNIFETTMENMRKDRISNTLMPGITESFSGNGAKNIVYRYIQEGGPTIVTFVRNVPDPDKARRDDQNATSSPIDGSLLEDDIMDVIISPDTKSMFYLTKTPDFNTSVAIGSVFNFQKNTVTRVFQSPFSEWLPVSFDGKTVMLQTKASKSVPGFLYSMNISNGELYKVIGDIDGLTALPSPDQQKILYSKSTRGGITLYLYNRQERITVDIPLATLPEKCVWNIDSTALYCAAPDNIPSADYPDAWYQGSIAFKDSMWKVDPKTGKTDVLFLPSAFGGVELDIYKPILSPNGEYLFFINKTDSTLWGYDFRR